MVNKVFKKSNCSTPKDAKRSTVTTKTGSSQSNALSCKKTNNAAKDCKRLQSACLPKLTCFTSPTIQKTVHHSYESASSKNLPKPIKTKVNPKNTKLVNSPSSVLRFPLSSTSTSPASSIDGDLRLSGLLSTRELFMINKGLKKSNLTTPKDAKRSKVTTKTDGSRSNWAQDSKPGGVSKYSTCFTSPTIQKTVHRSCESSSKNLSKSVKRNVNSKSMKSVNYPLSAQHLPLSPSSTFPASSIHGKSLLSTPVTPLNTIPVSNIKSQNYEERKFIRQNAPTGLRLPSPRIGFFDMVSDLILVSLH
ncbi:uncharacterized protein LOC143580441 [Bidens hawaiensis]|uniref:uncharacterized protein LOC143580441 n=1 Tax=Bidens hawaiensis TaxID=980011 RepID=UPI00404AA679